MTTIPVIDVAGPRRAAAEAIGRACTETGFFAVAGHGVDTALMARLYGEAKAFFDLPEAEKLRVGRPRPEQNRGYIASGTETLARLAGQETPPDFKQVFTIGPETPPGDPYYADPAAYPNFAPNLWPGRPEGLKPAMLAYWAAMTDLAGRLLDLCGEALALPPGFFADKTDRHISMLRVIDYPPYRGEPQPGQLRAGAHTDLNMLTILHSDNTLGGLEVRDRAGRWVAPPALPDAFVVNIGDIMMRWTNDVWISTPHRVVNPPAGAGAAARRISLAFFFQANHDAVVDCLPTCRSEGRPARYPPISVGAYRTARFAATANAAAPG